MVAQKQRILCVDDEAFNLKLLEAVLVPRGYEVLKARDGLEALQTVEKEAVDLVLLDVMMPNLDGYEVCRRLKENTRFMHIPVIMTTALTERKDRIKGIEMGAEDFISKPLDTGEVLARIKMLLKMKELNYRLNSAYASITHLISFGREFFSRFDTSRMEFASTVDSIVSQLIRTRPELVDRPEKVVVGFTEEADQWRWRRYEWKGGHLQIDHLDQADVHWGDFQQMAKVDARFFNAEFPDTPDFKVFLAQADKLDINPSNMACHIGDSIRIFAFDYGRPVMVYDVEVLNSIVMHGLFVKSLSAQVKETESAFDYLVYALARASEANDEDTGDHILRVGEYCALISEKLGMPPAFTANIRQQAPLHDVGKIHIHPDLLRKPGKLTPEEWTEMKKHTLYGARIIGDNQRLATAKTIALTHHERYDGSGYPHGLRGEDIPIEGRILAIADQYDALRTQRVYKPAIGHETTYKIIVDGDGRSRPNHFDPAVLDAFMQSETLFRELYDQMT